MVESRLQPPTSDLQFTMNDLTLDHVIVGVEDLGASAAALAAVLGRRPSWRGRHPTYGTANVLFRLESSYIELLAPDPDASSDTAWTGSLGRFLKARGGGLFSIALQTADVAATTALARGRGLPVEEPLPGSGVDLHTGATREWVNARIPPEATRGTRCFFIQHRSPASALPSAPPTGDAAAAARDIAGVIAVSSEPEGARRMWREVFGLPESEAGSGGWRFGLGNANLFLQAGLESGAGRPAEAGQAPDKWDSVILTVSNLEEASRHLREAGFSLDPVTAAGFGGLEVNVCGAKLVLTEAI